MRTGAPGMAAGSRRRPAVRREGAESGLGRGGPLSPSPPRVTAVVGSVGGRRWQPPQGGLPKLGACSPGPGTARAGRGFVLAPGPPGRASLGWGERSAACGPNWPQVTGVPKLGRRVEARWCSWCACRSSGGARGCCWARCLGAQIRGEGTGTLRVLKAHQQGQPLNSDATVAAVVWSLKLALAC